MSNHAEDEGLPGGGVYAITATTQNIDLTAFSGYVVSLVCPDVDMYINFAPNSEAAGTIIITATAMGTTSYVGDPIGATVKVKRFVGAKNGRLLVRTVTGSGNLFIKPIRRP